MSKSTKSDSPGAFRLTLDIETTLNWLEELAKKHALPPHIISSLKLIRTFTNKAIDVSFRIVNKEIPPERPEKV